MKTSVSQLFDDAFLKSLEGLVLLARQLSRSRQMAERRSAHHGASVEFAEYRPFQSGDDWRHIDWHAFARWRTLVLKLYSEEQDLPVYLLCDSTASMDWGVPSKFDQARRIAAGLAYIGLDGQDRVGVTALGGKGKFSQLSPGRGKQRFHPILRHLSAMEASGKPDSLDLAVGRWLATRPQRGVAIWISDLWGSDSTDALNALNRIRYSGHEVSVIHVMDPSEAEAGDVGEFRLDDREGGEAMTVVVDQRLRRAYKERFEAYLAELARACRRHEIPYLPVNTDENVTEILTRSLRQKGFLQ
jgi:uncharacterized protein (DUF58 family)